MAQLKASFDRKPVSLRIIAAGSQIQPGVPQLQRVADSMYEFGLTPGAKAPYQVAGMIAREPGRTGG